MMNYPSHWFYGNYGDFELKNYPVTSPFPILGGARFVVQVNTLEGRTFYSIFESLN